MIAHYANYHNPSCDICGHMLAAEKSDEAAEVAMVAAGWIKRDGRDVCRLCQRKAAEREMRPEGERNDQI